MIEQLALSDTIIPLWYFDLVRLHITLRYNFNIPHADTEENAVKLQKAVVDAAKEITDVVAAIGGFTEGGPLLQQSVDFLMEVSHTTLLVSVSN